MYLCVYCVYGKQCSAQTIYGGARCECGAQNKYVTSGLLTEICHSLRPCSTTMMFSRLDASLATCFFICDAAAVVVVVVMLKMLHVFDIRNFKFRHLDLMLKCGDEHSDYGNFCATMGLRHIRTKRKHRVKSQMYTSSYDM